MFKELNSLVEIKEGDIIEIVEMFQGEPGSIFRGVAVEYSRTLGWSTDINFPLMRTSKGEYIMALDLKSNGSFSFGGYLRKDGTVDKSKIARAEDDNIHISTGLVGASDFVDGNKVYVLDSLTSTSEFVTRLAVR